MQNLKCVILVLIAGTMMCGCKKKQEPSEPVQPTEETGREQSPPKEEEPRKEIAMELTLQWLGHASFKIGYGQTVIYIDPWKIKELSHDASCVLVSHSHYDHYSPEDIRNISRPDTTLIASADVIAKEPGGRVIEPGMMIEFDGVKVTGIPAYNPDKDYHPKSNNWLGFVIEIGPKRIYYAGDTDLTDEMKALQNIDVALVPVGGTYTMNATEAAEAVGLFKPAMVVPYHWGDIVGGKEDAEQFAEAVSAEARLLMPGETLRIE